MKLELRKKQFAKSGGSQATVSFKDWLSEVQEGSYKFLVGYILLPTKYPSGALILISEDIRIKLTLKPEEVDNIVKAYRLRKGKDKEGLKLYAIVNVDRVGYTLELEEELVKEGGYEATNYGFRYVDKFSDDIVDELKDF